MMMISEPLKPTQILNPLLNTLHLEISLLGTSCTAAAVMSMQ